MTAEEYRKKIIRRNLLIVAVLAICLAGIVGAVTYYNKLKEAKAEVQLKNDSLKIRTRELVEANRSLEILKDSLARQKEQYANILVSKNSTAINTVALRIEKSRDDARTYAREGYAKLKSRDFKGALKAFDMSEKSYNGYRDSYEVYFLLWTNRDKLDDPAVQKQIMQQVYSKHNSLRIISREDVR